MTAAAATRGRTDADVVVPTVGRPSFGALLEALVPQAHALTGELIVVDDRARRDGPLPAPPPELGGRLRVLPGPARGPAAARNAGWRAARGEWVAFLDDDVMPAGDWAETLRRDLAAAGPGVAAVQGRVDVPLPEDRRPTDWERNVAGLAEARWVTADMAYRRADLEAAGGFDERFTRAYREDSDLALRVRRRGRELVRGERRVRHPVRPAGPLVSLRLQAGNADDALMRTLHGPGWREQAGAPPGRLPRHAATTAAGLTALAALAVGGRRATALAAAGWLAGTAELAWARIAPGPRRAREVATMLGTSLAMPPLATFWRVVGEVRGRRGAEGGRGRPPEAVLLDRDGTLVVDVPYNGDPERVVPVPGAREALDRLRAAGVKLAVVSNQSGVGRGLISGEQVAAVNRRVERLLGPVGPWLVCPHAPDAGCGCRKPAPGLVLQAADRLGVAPERCVVIGDVGADVEAALAAGAGAVLVPTERTRREEVDAAPRVARSLSSAVELLVGGGGR